MKIVNIGIVAHVDAGKTSLTERILFETNVITKIGRVDHGDTQTDSLDLEKRRGITIKAAVVSFALHDRKVNLIDTPGHADFIAEVERSFRVLDGAILVISAVEGIQAQTKFLMAVLARLAIPTLIFINKIDRMGAQSDSLIEQIRAKLTDAILPLYTPSGLGTKTVAIAENCFDDERDPDFWEASLDLLTRHDEQLLAAYVHGGAVTAAALRDSLAAQVQAAQLYPIFFGSAMTGVGVAELLTGITTFFPSNANADQEPLSAVVFKIEREATGEKIAYLRIFAGTLHVRAEVPIRRKSHQAEWETHTEKVKLIHHFHAGKSVQMTTVGAGEFCKAWGLADVKIGDVVGEWCERIQNLQLVQPQLETRIEAQEPAQSHELYQALVALTEEDPLINVSRDPFHGELYLRIFGEVQKEVLEALLQEKYGLAVRFAETRVICIEKPVGTGAALDEMGAPGNPFVATVGLRVEPGPVGSGIRYEREVMLGSLPLPLHRTIEEALFATLQQGLYGWEVTDIAIFLTHTAYSSVATTAGDFRNLVPLVLMDALTRAGTAVYEPLNEFELSAPTHAISQAIYRLTTADASFERPILHAETFLLTGTIPVATTEPFKRNLSEITEGEGLLLTKPAGFRPIVGEFPTRKRVDFNPLNRKDYMLHIRGTY